MQMFDIGKELQKAYDEGYVRGVEDFAERLKDIYTLHDGLQMTIDNLVREMTEEK